jgi:UDP-N-acetylmuramate--alanine ligase
LTYGLSDDADVRGRIVEQKGMRSTFEVTLPGKDKPFMVELNLPGVHNVLNALAAIAVAFEMDIGINAVRTSLSEFEGIGRRFQVHGEIPTASGHVLLIDDYGHHPTEISATLDAVRSGWPGRRVILLFQPHRYTRTHDLLDDFVKVLSQPDILLLTEVYPAGEEPIDGADGRALARAIRSRGEIEPVFIHDMNNIPQVLTGLLEDGDVLAVLGAGDIGAVAAGLPDMLKQQAEAAS